MTYEFFNEIVLAWLAEQGIEPHEVMQALLGPDHWPRPMTTAEGLRVLTIWGQTSKGRGLVIVVKPASTRFNWDIVQAMEMSTWQWEQFKQHLEER